MSHLKNEEADEMKPRFGRGDNGRDEPMKPDRRRDQDHANRAKKDHIDRDIDRCLKSPQR